VPKLFQIPTTFDSISSIISIDANFVYILVSISQEMSVKKIFSRYSRDILEKFERKKSKFQLVFNCYHEVLARL
jgi:hypothetical protein